MKSNGQLIWCPACTESVRVALSHHAKWAHVPDLLDHLVASHPNCVREIQPRGGVLGGLEALYRCACGHEGRDHEMHAHLCVHHFHLGGLREHFTLATVLA